jgi:hypothetical protein
MNNAALSLAASVWLSLYQVEAAHAALSAAYPSTQRVLGGADGDVQQLFEFSRRLDPLMPFDAKHAAQHASLVGEC